MTDELDFCAVCNGSGEGQYDGSSCPSCKGRGVPVDTATQQEHEEYQAELKWEEIQHGYK